MAKRADTPTIPEAAPPPTEPPPDPPSPERLAAEEQLKAVQRQILDLSTELLTAEDRDVPRITRQLQRCRVTMLALREIATDLADPTTYRELTLLNRLLTGHDLEEDAARQAQEAEEQAGRQRLDDLGLEPEQAGSMVRALSALQQIMAGNKLGPASTVPATPDDEDLTNGNAPRRRRRTARTEAG